MVENLVLQYQESTRRRELPSDKILCDGGCGRRVPLAALHHNHGLPEWCGTISLDGGRVLCPACADELTGESHVRL